MIELEAALAALSEHGNNKAATAKALGITRSKLRRLLEKHEVELGEATGCRQCEVQLREAKSKLRLALDHRIDKEAFERFVTDALAVERTPPDWVVQAGAPTSHNIAMQQLSDIHYPEVVLPEEVMWMNAYNHDIAEKRIRNFFEGAARISTEILPALKIDGTVQFWQGDFLSGDIHEELSETNEFTLYEALLRLTDMLVAGVRMLQKHTGKPVHIVAVPGNHPRNSRKPKFKGYARNNADWLLYHLVAREFKDDPNVTFRIGTGTDETVTVLGWKYRVTHGDRAKGGSGIAGALSPLLLMDARKRKQAAAAGEPFDYLVVGHWHQWMPGAFDIMVNGSVVGYNEFAFGLSLPFQRPIQAYWITHPTRGATYRTPIFVEDESEGWRSSAPVPVEQQLQGGQ